MPTFMKMDFTFLLTMDFLVVMFAFLFVDMFEDVYKRQEQQMVAVARALIGEPKLLILDEPSLGLAPNIVDDILNVASTLAKNDGISVLLVEQDITKALASADRGYVIENGRIALEGTSAELQANEHVKKAYLGI